MTQSISNLPTLEVDDRGMKYVQGRYARYYVGCITCEREMETGSSFFPPHNARESCESGKHNHCSCDTCF